MEFDFLYIPGIFILSFLVVIFALPSYIKLLDRKNIVDKPDYRKVHARDIPTMGGVIIVLGMMITILFFFPLEQLIEFRFFIGSLLIMFIVGVRDDLIPLKPLIKLISQLVPIFIVIFFFDIRIESLYTLTDFEFPYWFQIFITAFTMVIIINSFNLIDGIDGLSGSLSLLSVFAFATIFYFSGNTFFAFLLIALGGSVIGFLVFNWSPAKIFMGDNGALFIGFVLSCAAILFINGNVDSKLQFSGSIGVAIAIMAIPLYDMFRIIILRIINKRELMEPDKNHFHHLLLKSGLSHSQITLTLFSIQGLLIVVALLGKSLSDLALFAIMATVLFSINGIVYYRLVRKSKTQKSRI